MSSFYSFPSFLWENRAALILQRIDIIEGVLFTVEYRKDLVGIEKILQGIIVEKCRRISARNCRRLQRSYREPCWPVALLQSHRVAVLSKQFNSYLGFELKF